MNNLIIGILCLALSIFIFFFSPKEGRNLLGYKSPQQGMNKNIWKWSNRCFGILAIIGSSTYLLTTIVLKFLDIDDYNSIINQYGMIYIFACILVTELYTFIQSQKKNKSNS